MQPTPSQRGAVSTQPKPSLANRRQFLATSAASGLITAGYFSSCSAKESTSPNERLNLACIGTANQAAYDIGECKHEHIAVLCDVDANYIEQNLKTFTDARTYVDYREMLEKEADKIDAVIVATPDHHHAPATMRAIRAGKHVYCEKPLSHTVQEARWITDAARAAGVATQLGTQIHASDNYRRVVEIIQAGTIGQVNEVHVWVGGKGWGGGDRPEVTDEPPAQLSWDIWLGDAPVRPYARGRYHPAQWRRWWDFGQGTLGDMGCHYMDLPYWALGLRYPVEIEAEGPPVHPDTAPLGLTVRYRFAEPALDFTWYNDTQIPKAIHGTSVPGNGVMFVGSEGMMFADYGKYRLFPVEKFQDFTPPAQTIPKSIGHHREWLKACRDGSPTTCNFDYSGPLSECVLLGNVAYRSGKKITWNAEELKTNHPDAQQYISKQYRSGWEVV